MIAPPIAEKLNANAEGARTVVGLGIQLGIPLAAFSASIAYFDSYRSGRLASNLIQAQRDYFGAHTYERIDREGTFHTSWGA
ncbi:6-phosphogluconate dehydrogenase [Catalinimonas alkaloidigena]|uniref:hypothetical protein n=1 Tax=Catalinimonas alkaloidigena TaxID=1075417 RepID=UPI0030B90B3D|nr:6-phosphogluconate dehydrogenase [Catalinimonas alkaloidigena]